MKVLICDPPEGWKYGFPKPYIEEDHENFEGFLRYNKYPETLIPFAVKYSRYWEATICDSCLENLADYPSNLCPGCEAYKEHQS